MKKEVFEGVLIAAGYISFVVFLEERQVFRKFYEKFISLASLSIIDRILFVNKSRKLKSNDFILVFLVIFAILSIMWLYYEHFDFDHKRSVPKNV